MGQRVVIRFPADREAAYYTEVFHFAESLWGPVVNDGLGKLNNIDQGREVVWVELAGKRHCGAVKRIVKKALQRHKLMDGVVTVENGE